MADRTVSLALQLKITGFQSKLRQAQQDTKKFSEELHKQTAQNRDGLNDIAGGMAKVGLAAGAAAGIAIKKFADFDAQMSKVRAATHATAGDMGLLKDAALEAGARTAFSATEAAAAIENLAKAGVSTADILNGGLNGALDLAAAGELGVAEAAETAATAMTQFGLAGKDVPHIADLLAAAAGKAQGEVSDMAQALNQSGLVASQMGLSIEETTGTLAAFASAGLLGSDAGTSFKTMLLALANPSKEASKTMRDLGINAYDAQGAFVGIAPLAEQLKSKLSSLSQQQRDSTLATIFGSDAIRAASVLYKQGGEGVAEWTTKVNDAGYAAETAAIKQDNLRGDIEKLGGSIQTELIEGGSGANDTLRGLAQGAEAAVSGFSELPDVVTQGATALAAVGAVGTLSAAGLLKGVTAASELRESWQSLGRTGKTLTLSMGAVGVAIAAGLIVYGKFAQKNQEAAAKVETLRDTLDEQTGAITGNTRAFVANEFAQNGMAQAAKDLGLNLALVTDAALGNEAAMAAVKTQLDAVVAVNDRYARGSQNSASEKQAEAAKRLSAELFGMNGNLTEAQKKQRLAAEGAVEHKTAQEKQSAAVAASNKKIADQADLLKKQTEAAFKAAGNALSFRAAQSSLAESIAKANQSIKDNGKGLRLNTEEGRANSAALDDLAEAANDVTESMLQNGKSHDAARKNAEKAKAEFIRVAIRMGLSKKAAKELADELIAIPPKATTDVTNNAPAAKKKVEDYQRQLGITPTSIPTQFAPKTTAATKTVQSYQRQLGLTDTDIPTHLRTTGIPLATRQISNFGQQVDKTLGGIADQTVNVSLAYSKALGQRTKQQTFATGGPVWGAGSETSDSIDARLSNDEHVLTAKEVRGAGGHGAIIAMRREWAKGYASGGAVGLGVHADVPSHKAVAGVASSIAKEYGKALAKAQQEAPVFPGGPGGRGNFRGKTLNARTVSMVLAAERILGSAFRIMQGSYSTSVAASGSTHAGGGVIDTDGPGGWGAAESALRRVGFAAWHRRPSQGPWGHHIHAVAIGDPTASPSAKRQVQSFRAGGDGLGGRGMANGGPVGVNMDQALARGVLLRDRGGPLPTGTSIVQNNTGGPEYVMPGGGYGGQVLKRVFFTVAQLVKAVERSVTAYDKAATQVGKTTDRIRDLVAQKNEFAAASASSFTGSLFGQGTGAGDLKLRLDARANDARGFRADLITLQKKGLNKSLLGELMKSSDYGAANELSQMTPAQLLAISKSYIASAKAAQQVGIFAGHTQFGGQIRNAQADLKRAQATAKAIVKEMHGMQVAIKGGKGSYILVHSNG